MPTLLKTRWLPELLVASVLLVAALAGTTFYSAPGSPSSRASPLLVVPATNASGPLSYHSALYVNATGPTGSIFPGEEITAQFRVQVPTYSTAAGVGQVRVPNSLIQFSSNSGTLRVYLSAANFTIVNNGSQELLAGPSIRWTSGVTFNASSTALMSTQGLAVMASWPYGEYPVQFSWRWVMTAVDGTPSSGFWSPWSQVTPPQIANLAGTPAKNWQLGAPYQLCLNGPIGGRTFEVHVSIANPVEQYTGASFEVPTNFGAAYCWNNSVPSNTTPQQAFIHIWEFANVTFQLYDYPIYLTNNQSNSTSLVAFLVTGWVPVLIGAAVVIGVVVAVELTLLNARQRRGGA